MQVTETRWKRNGTGGILVLTALLLCGCGQGDYEKQMVTRKGQLAFATKFLQNLHSAPTELVEGVIEIKMPKFLTDAAGRWQTGSLDRRQDPINPQRLQPAYLKIPGYRFCYEQFETVGQRDMSTYIYVGVVKASDSSPEAIELDVQRQVRAVFQGAVWQRVELDTPDGGKLACRRISCRGPQAFETSIQGGDLQQLPGRMDLYLYSTPAAHVLIGFRAPDQLPTAENVFTHAELAIGTLKTLSTTPDGS